MVSSESFDFYQKGRDLMEQGRLEEAIVHFRQSIAADPHFKSLELLGECLMRLDRHCEAVVPLAAATSLNRGVRAPSLLAEVFTKLGQFHDANEMADIALSRDPKNQRALQTKAEATRHITDA